MNTPTFTKPGISTSKLFRKATTAMILSWISLQANAQVDYSLSFVKANSQYVTVPHSASLNLTTTFTMEAVVNYSGSNSTIVDKGNYDYLWSLNANNNANKMGFYMASSNTWVYSTNPVPQNTKTHVAITLGGGTLTFYINGVASGTAAAFTAQDNQPMNIGRQQPTSCQCNHFNGTMDELRIWNIARTQTDIQANINGSVPANSAGLAAYYRFNEGSGTTTADATANGNNGTLINGPSFVLQIPASSQAALVQPDAKLVGTGLTGYAGQGESVDVSADGNSAVVGGSLDDGGRGAVWFYKKVSGAWQLEGPKITVGSSGFGTSVSISADGNTAVIGSPGDNGGIGATWIFVRTAGVWAQQGNKLVGTGFVGASNQGQSVAISADGNRIVTGGYKDNTNGSVWLFYRTGTTWAQFASKLTPTGFIGPLSVEMGYSVALSGDGHTIMIGGRADNNNIGASWIFKDDGAGNGWVQKAKLVGNNVVGVAVQGSSVSLSNDGLTAVTGGWADDNGVGAAWGFTSSNGTTWAQYGNILHIPGGEQLSLGTSVAISGDGNTLLAGAPLKQTGGATTGAAYAFLKSPDFHVGWTLQTSVLLGTGSTGLLSTQGTSVSISADGNTALSGAPDDDTVTGAVWAFARSGNTWSQQGPKLVGPGAISPTSQGFAVGIAADGNTAVVGGPDHDNAKGAIWIYTRSATGWTQLQQITGTTSLNSVLGTSVAISADGNTIFAGSKNDDNGKGAVFVYTRSGGLFGQQAKLVGSSGSSQSYQGTSVSCSATGNTVIFGAPGDDDINGVGAAFIFTRTGSTWTQKAKLLGTATVTQGQQMGNAVAMSADGTMAIVGASPCTQCQYGYPLTRRSVCLCLNAGTWAQQTRLTQAAQNVYFGTAVTLSADGTTAAVGGPTYSSEQGGTWVYTRSGSTWSLQTLLQPSGNVGAAKTGTSVAISASGDRLLIGGPSDNNGAGATWMYNRSGASWSQASKLLGTGGIGNANQGVSVAIALDGANAIIGGNADNRGYGAAWTFTAQQNCSLPTTRLYVDAAATGAKNGNSWADAYSDLQQALRAYKLCSGVAEIWVAKGTYKPAPAGGDKNLSFMVPTGAKIYGGFAGTETTVAGRDLKALGTINRTILSGDLNGDDGTNFTNRSDNSYTVVNITQGSVTTILNGFTITGGNASQESNGMGGGIVVLRSDRTTISDCVIKDNSAFIRGGGIYNEAGTIMPTRLAITDNRAPEGAGCYNYWKTGTTGNNTIFVSSVFINNTAPFGQGAAVYNYSDNTVAAGYTFYQCSFAGNIAANGGIYNNRAGTGTVAINFSGCAFYNNGGATTLVNVHSGAGLPTITTTTSLFEAAVTGYTGTGTVITATSPFLSATDLHLPCGSAAIDAGGSYPPAALKDLDNNNRLSTPLVDIGAYEKQTTTTWLGYTTDWATPTNWTGAMAPDACTDVIVNAGTPFTPVVTGVNNVCQRLTVNSGGNVKVVAGAILTVVK